jgi:hypothetical protein
MRGLQAPALPPLPSAANAIHAPPPGSVLAFKPSKNNKSHSWNNNSSPYVTRSMPLCLAPAISERRSLAGQRRPMPLPSKSTKVLKTSQAICKPPQMRFPSSLLTGARHPAPLSPAPPSHHTPGTSRLRTRCTYCTYPGTCARRTRSSRRMRSGAGSSFLDGAAARNVKGSRGIWWLVLIVSLAAGCSALLVAARNERDFRDLLPFLWAPPLVLALICAGFLRRREHFNPMAMPSLPSTRDRRPSRRTATAQRGR